MAARRAAAMALLGALGVLLLASTPVLAKATKASDFFTLCRRSDRDLGGCVKRSIEESKSKIIKGIPEVRLQPIDPLYFSSMEIREGQDNFLFALKMDNMMVTGLKDLTIETVKVDLAKGTWTLDMKTPHMHLDADYEMQGNILALPIQGNGKCTLDFDGVTTVCQIKYRNTTQGNKTYAQVDSLKWDINVEGAKSHFANLFKGNKTRGDTTNKFLNENWKGAFETYKHLPEEAFAQFAIELFKRFFEQFPLDELFPA